MEPVRPRGAPRWRVHDADLQKHLDGAGGEQPVESRQWVQDHVLRAAAARALIKVVEFDDPTRVVDYEKTGRVKLTTLTREFFVPGFLERDEGEREPPYEAYPWDGISGVRPFHGFVQSTTVGVY